VKARLKKEVKKTIGYRSAGEIEERMHEVENFVFELCSVIRGVHRISSGMDFFREHIICGIWSGSGFLDGKVIRSAAELQPPQRRGAVLRECKTCHPKPSSRRPIGEPLRTILGKPGPVSATLLITIAPAFGDALAQLQPLQLEISPKILSEFQGRRRGQGPSAKCYS